MKTLTVQVDESSVVRVPPEARPSGRSQLMLIVAEPGDNGLSDEMMAQIAQQRGVMRLSPFKELLCKCFVFSGFRRQWFRGVFRLAKANPKEFIHPSPACA